ncbi:hypothetical protein J1N35_021449 [Gossypium stocksii]|uniref:Uncharacterized protein n=1 Tax=Gossypium stocksii TaxID=47602 RepID=A0A9D3VER6_9ROSI|nr:hypothetical protein J1N35_021449 [Gossypium stocksii]
MRGQKEWRSLNYKLNKNCYVQEMPPLCPLNLADCLNGRQSKDFGYPFDTLGSNFLDESSAFPEDKVPHGKHPTIISWLRHFIKYYVFMISRSFFHHYKSPVYGL